MYIIEVSSLALILHYMILMSNCVISPHKVISFFEDCLPSALCYMSVSCIEQRFVHCRNDWNAEEDQPESGSADYAGAVPRRVRLLSPFLDPAWGVPAVFHTGIIAWQKRYDTGHDTQEIFFGLTEINHIKNIAYYKLFE